MPRPELGCTGQYQKASKATFQKKLGAVSYPRRELRRGLRGENARTADTPQSTLTGRQSVNAICTHTQTQIIVAESFCNCVCFRDWKNIAGGIAR